MLEAPAHRVGARDYGDVLVGRIGNLVVQEALDVVVEEAWSGRFRNGLLVLIQVNLIVR